MCVCVCCVCRIQKSFINVWSTSENKIKQFQLEIYYSSCILLTVQALNGNSEWRKKIKCSQRRTITNSETKSNALKCMHVWNREEKKRRITLYPSNLPSTFFHLLFFPRSHNCCFAFFFQLLKHEPNPFRVYIYTFLILTHFHCVCVQLYQNAWHSKWNRDFKPVRKTAYGFFRFFPHSKCKNEDIIVNDCFSADAVAKAVAVDAVAWLTDERESKLSTTKNV